MTARDIHPNRTLFLAAVLLLAGILLVLPRQIDLNLTRYLFAWFAGIGLAILVSLFFSILRWLKPIADPPPLPRWLMIALVARLAIFGAFFLTIVVMLATLPFGWGSQALNQSVLLGLFSATLASLWWNAIHLAWERLRPTPAPPPAAH